MTHVIFDLKLQSFFCLHCKASQAVYESMTVGDLESEARVFKETHLHCKQLPCCIECGLGMHPHDKSKPDANVCKDCAGAKC